MAKLVSARSLYDQLGPLHAPILMLVYDALYAGCKTARDELHSWPKPASVA